MYRNHNYSLDSDSVDSNGNQDTSENYQVLEKHNESISDLFKNMSLRDRNSRKLSDLSNLRNDQNAKANKDFMTSSPIRMDSVMKAPIFIKNQSNDPHFSEDKLTDENKENITEKPLACSIKTAEDNQLLPDMKSNNKIVSKSENLIHPSTIDLTSLGPLTRTLTVKHINKPPISTQDISESKDKQSIERQVSKRNVRRSISFCRSTTSLNSTSRITVPKPFSFENKDKAMLLNRIKIVNDDLLEKKRLASAFRANPMPISSPKLPEKIVQKPTVPVSFKFESDQRVNYHQEKNLLKSFADSSLFSSSADLSSSKTSNDISYLSRSPFMPKPSMKPATIPETPHFKLKSRIEQRREFDDHVRQIEQKALKVREELEQKKAEQERMEYEELRKMTNIKANPIRQYKKVDIVHPHKSTLAQSPKFSDRFKK